MSDSTAAIRLTLTSDFSHEIDPLARELDMLPARAFAATEIAVAATAEALADTLTTEFAPHDKSGKGRSRMHVEHHGLTSEIVAANAGWVQFGSRAHDITASVDGPPLAWEGGSFGEGWHFARSVHHPGYAGDDVAGRAIRDVDMATIAAKLGTFAFGPLLSFSSVTGV